MTQSSEKVEIDPDDKHFRKDRHSTAKYSRRTGHFFGKYRVKRDYGNVMVTVKGNCCWRYYAWPGFRGNSILVVPSGGDYQLGFKSVRQEDC